MDQRRFVTFILVSMLIWMTWFNFVAPWLGLLPPMPKRPPVVEKVSEEDESGRAADALLPANVKVGVVEAVALKVPQHEAKTLWVGPTLEEVKVNLNLEDKLNEFFLSAKFNTRGAVIEQIELTDIERYPAFMKRKERLDIVGANRLTRRRTFELNTSAFDDKLAEQKLNEIPWEVVAQTANSVTFRIQSADGTWEAQKHYELKQLTSEERKKPLVRETFADGYQIKLTVSFKNLSDRERDLNYTLLGPVGVPLEDEDNTYKYRDVRMGFRDEKGGTGVSDNKVTAKEVVTKEKSQKTPIWKRPIKYIGVDVLYFAALVSPQEDQVNKDTRTVESTKAVVITENQINSAYSDVAVEFNSVKQVVAPGKSVEHGYTLYAGPKRKELVQQVAAGAVMDFGWFDSICQGMVWILKSLHGLGLSYGLSIIALTILVRLLLMPISKHQAVHAAKMKEMQPRIMARQKELEARYGKNTDEYLKASQELVAEQSRMMLGGCLPMFLQLPIFIALYRAISSSIELRMEPFLWFQSLASPDALFAFPGKIPLLGWTEFNLLPWISMGLMLAHQKLTMPPPANEEQAQQYKIMNFMMIVMVYAFYRVPAGLGIYFICTNIWSMAERWFFEHQTKKQKAQQELMSGPNSETQPAPAAKSVPAEAAVPPAEQSGLTGLWNRMQEAADIQKTIRNKNAEDDNAQRPASGNRNGQSSLDQFKKKKKR